MSASTDRRRDGHPQPSTKQRSDVARIGDLEVGQDIAFERRWWALQRASWIALGLLIALAFTGLLGHGPVNRVVCGEGGTLSIEHERFARLLSPSPMVVRVADDGVKDRVIRIAISERTAKCVAVDVAKTSPRPRAVESRPAGVVYVFEAPEARGTREISFMLTPTRVGRCPAEIALGDAPAHAFDQWILP